MLAALDIASVDDLFADIPAALRIGRLDLPEPEPELELAARLGRLAAQNRVDLASFLGAGAYRHYSPPVVDQILLRGEWYTAYTPYQPEVSQGTLQSIYEYESLIAELVALDVVSASHYDGAAATAEAALMTCRTTRRERVLVSRGVHRQYRETIETYFRGGELDIDEIPLVADGPAAGTTDLAALERLLAAVDRPVAGVVAAQPNFLGLLEEMAEVGRLAHGAGALFVAVVEPVSLAVLEPPGAYGADIAAGEGQSLGIPLGYGGPYLGLLASTEALVRQIPGRLVGMTTDLEGRRAFVMTLRAREQDIRREKAASNICTNQALLALAAGVYLAAVGPHGLRDVAALGAVRAAELETALAAVGALLEHTLQLLINTLSFVRVGAFALAHAGLSAAVVALADAAGGAGYWIVLVLGNALILALEGLVVGIQTTRLLLFEFFVRFLEGTGRPFRPLAPPVAGTISSIGESR